MIFEDILKTIKDSKNIAIFSHMNSDGDAIGSSVALMLALQKMGKTVSIFVPEPVDEKYSIIGSSKVNVENSANFDLAIGLDCPNIKRFGNKLKYYKKIKFSINIDHHSDNKNYGNINCVNPQASSVSEIIYLMLKNWKVEISPEIATCLYAGISTDTGRFLHTNTSPETLKYASELATFGADIFAINYNLFEKISIDEINLFKVVLNKLELYKKNQIAIVCLTKTDFKNTNTIPQQTYRFPDFINGIDGVKITIVMAESDRNEWVVSIRSRDAIAQKIAVKFGGGGHPRASGCRIFSNLRVAKKAIIEVSSKELSR